MSFSYGYVNIPGLAPAQQAAFFAYQRRQANANRQRAISNPQRLSSVLSTASAPPPSPSGLRMIQNIVTVTAQWNPVPVPVLYYEIMVADNAEMSNSVTHRRTETTFTHEEAQSGITYFIRIRAVTSQGISDWSQILNSETGLADYLDLQPGAATEFTSEAILDFEPSLVDSFNGPYQLRTREIPFVTVEGGIVSPRFTLRFLWNCQILLWPTLPAIPPLMVSSILIDGYVLDDAWTDWISVSAVLPTMYIATVSGLGQDVALDPGQHFLHFELAVQSFGIPNQLIIQPSSANITISETRN